MIWTIQNSNAEELFFSFSFLLKSFEITSIILLSVVSTPPGNANLTTLTWNAGNNFQSAFFSESGEFYSQWTFWGEARYDQLTLVRWRNIDSVEHFPLIHTKSYSVHAQFTPQRGTHRWLQQLLASNGLFLVARSRPVFVWHLLTDISTILTFSTCC